MKISLEAGRPEGAWASWNEFCGTGDGQTVSFPLPFPKDKARGLLVMRDYEPIESDARFRATDLDGKVISDEADGWAIDDENHVVFQRPPRVGARISVSALDRKVGDAFKIVALDSTMAKKLDERMPPELKNRKRGDLAKFPSIQEMCRLNFMELVTDWSGITDAAGNPLPCDEKNKRLFLDRTDSVGFGMFATERARTLQRERQAGFEAEVRD